MPPDENNTNHHAGCAYRSEQEDVLTELDPQLQSIILARRQGQELPRNLIEKVTEDGKEYIAVDVIARLKTPGQVVPGLWVVQTIGPFVTGLVDVDRIAEVRGQVDSLKAARTVEQTLSNSVPEINGSQEQIFAATGRHVDGSNVIIGIVDHGCDFAHPNFRTLDGNRSTRILFLWDQRAGTDPRSPEDFGYGREFDTAAINDALENPQPGPDGPHQALGYQLNGAHGTHVMDIAAGNGGGQNPPGVAPGADIIFVESSLGQLEPGQSAGNSRHLVDAVKYIFNRASQLNRPAVVNISLSTDAGPHDGSTPVEQAFDCMLRTPGRAIVMAAGNSANINKHLRRVIYPGETRTLVWNIQPNDYTTNKVELWYDGRRALELNLRLDQNTVLGPYPLATTHTIYKTVDGQEQVAGKVFHRANDSGNGDNNIVVEFGPLMEAGRWALELRCPDPPDYPPFDVNAWIERDGGTISIFLDEQPSDGLCTLGTLACGNSTIAVSAYDTFAPHGIMADSGAGPTRDGRLKPEVSAPGLGIRTATVLTNTAGPTTGGTSLAAPHVTGLVALLMEAAGSPLTIEEIRTLVMNPVRNHPPSAANAWDPRFGVGRIDVAASVADVPAPAPLPVDVIERTEVVAAELVGAGVGVGVGVAAFSSIVAPLFSVSPGPPAANGGSPDSGVADEEPPQTPPPVTTGH